MTEAQQILSILGETKGHAINSEDVYKLIISKNIKDPKVLSDLFKTPLINNQLRYLTVSPVLLDFLFSLLDVDGDVLIPWSDNGVLPTYISQKISPKSLTILENNSEHSDFIEQLVNNKTTVKCGEPIELVQKIERQFDFIIGIPPFGFLRTREEYKTAEVRVATEYSDVLIAHSLNLLKSRGKAAFVVAPTFFSQKRNSLFQQLKNLDINLLAVFDLPPGMWGPTTNMPSSFIIFEKEIQKKVFSALYSANKRQRKILINNFQKNNSGELVSQGVWQDFSSFKTINQLDNQERVDKLAGRFGMPLARFGDLIKKINSVDLSSDEEFHIDNSLYISRTGLGPVTSSANDSGGQQNNVIQIVLNDKQVYAPYLEGFLNNTSLGQAIREGFSYDRTIPHLQITALQDSSIFLPPIDQQREITNAQRIITNLKSQLAETENLLWSKPTEFLNTTKKLKKINHEENFVDWIDSLPFPLASILWSYHTQCKTPKERYEKLLHFFEALAEFLAIIHLSVHEKNELSIGWEESRDKINTQLQLNRLDIERATFGTWKTIYDVLTKKNRDALKSEDDQEIILNLYKTKSSQRIQALSEKSYSAIFTDAIAIRNTRLAHAGSIGARKAEEIHQKLLELLAEIRKVFTSIWYDYKLILPEDSRFTGSLHEYDAREVMGTRTPFEKTRLQVKEPLIDGRLHLFNQETNEAIDLLPFVQIKPGPKTELDTCYFYSRFERETGDARLISYHYGGEPDFSVSDESLISTLNYFKNNGEKL